jgi:hypothetical protein
MNPHIVRLSVICVVSGLSMSALSGESAAQPTTTGALQVSVGVGNVGPLFTNESVTSIDPVAAPNGDFVMFSSVARNFTHLESDQANPDQNLLEDIYKYSPSTGLELVSVVPSTGRAPSDSQSVFDGSRSPAISEVSPDGSYAFAFASGAVDLVPDYQQTSISANQRQVYVRLPLINQNVLVSVGSSATGATGNVGAKEECALPTIALAGTSPSRYLVAFTSTSPNLPPDNTATGSQTKNIFLSTVTVENGIASASTVKKLVENPSGELNYPNLSGDGRYLVFQSLATVIPGVTSASPQIYLFDTKLNTFELISKNTAGLPGNNISDRPSISYQGSLITFRTQATDVGLNNTRSIIVVYDRKTKKFSQINSNSSGTPSNGLPIWARIHPNGRFVSFSDDGTNLVTNTSGATPQTYLKDLATGATILVSATSSGVPGSDASGADQEEFSRGAMLSIGASGFTSRSAFITFSSAATNLASAGVPNGNHQFIFRSPITLPALQLESGARIESPPDVRIVKMLGGKKGARVSIDLTLFEVVDSTFARSIAFAAAATKIKVAYNVEIRKVGSRDTLRRTVTRNRITISRLTPGRYSIRYRASATKGRKTVRSGYSPKANIVIPSTS